MGVFGYQIMDTYLFSLFLYILIFSIVTKYFYDGGKALYNDGANLGQ